MQRWLVEAVNLATLVDIANMTKSDDLIGWARNAAASVDHRRAATWRLAQVAPEQAETLLDAGDPEIVLAVAGVMSSRPVEHLMKLASDSYAPSGLRARALELLDVGVVREHLEEVVHIARNSSGKLLAAAVGALTSVSHKLPLDWLIARFRNVGRDARVGLVPAVGLHGAPSADWGLDMLELEIYDHCEEELLSLVRSYGTAQKHAHRLEQLSQIAPEAKYVAIRTLRDRAAGDKGGLALTEATGGGLSETGADEGQLSSIRD